MDNIDREYKSKAYKRLIAGVNSKHVRNVAALIQLAYSVAKEKNLDELDIAAEWADNSLAALINKHKL